MFHQHIGFKIFPTLQESFFSFSFNSFLASTDLFRKVVLGVSKEIKVIWHNQENVIIVFEGIEIVE